MDTTIPLIFFDKVIVLKHYNWAIFEKKTLCFVAKNEKREEAEDFRENKSERDSIVMKDGPLTKKKIKITTFKRKCQYDISNLNLMKKEGHRDYLYHNWRLLFV